MELRQFAEELKVRMEAEIDTISADQPDALRRTSLLIECVGRYAGELKRYVVKYKFRSIVIGKQQCTVFGNQECTTFGNKSAQKMATRVHSRWAN